MTAHFAPWAAADKEPRSFRQLSPWVHSRLAALGPALGAARNERRAVAGFGLWTTRITAVLSTLVHHGTGHQLHSHARVENADSRPPKSGRKSALWSW